MCLRLASTYSMDMNKRAHRMHLSTAKTLQLLKPQQQQQVHRMSHLCLGDYSLMPRYTIHTLTHDLYHCSSSTHGLWYLLPYYTIQKLIANEKRSPFAQHWMD